MHFRLHAKLKESVSDLQSYSTTLLTGECWVDWLARYVVEIVLELSSINDWLIDWQMVHWLSWQIVLLWHVVIAVTVEDVSSSVYAEIQSQDQSSLVDSWQLWWHTALSYRCHNWRQGMLFIFICFHHLKTCQSFTYTIILPIDKKLLSVWAEVTPNFIINLGSYSV